MIKEKNKKKFCKMSFGCCNAHTCLQESKASKKPLEFCIGQSELIHSNTDKKKGGEKWERESKQGKGAADIVVTTRVARETFPETPEVTSYVYQLCCHT